MEVWKFSKLRNNCESVFFRDSPIQLNIPKALVWSELEFLMI